MEAVSDLLKNTLTEIFEIHEFKDFYLGGGTNLALQFEHRVSTDIDLFCLPKVGISLEHKMLPLLEKKFKEKIILNSVNKNVVRCMIHNIKVDLLNFYDIKKNLKPTFYLNNWILCDTLDVAAMKIKAITNRGSLKDYYDLAFLLEKFTLNEIMFAYKSKYQMESDCQVIKYLVDFSEAELENINNISLINFQLSWDEVKIKIIKSTKEYLKQT